MWSDLHEPELKDMADFEELFAKKGGGVVRQKALSESFGAKPAVSRPVSVLDQKRSQAVGILMRSLHLEMADIRHAVYQLDCSTVDQESLQALWDNVRMAAGPPESRVVVMVLSLLLSPSHTASYSGGTGDDYCSSEHLP